MDLSRHPTHNFPLAVVSINATRWALEAARAVRLAVCSDDILLI